VSRDSIVDCARLPET